MESRGGGVEGGLILARARSSLFRRCAGTFHTLFSALHDIYYSQPATSSAYPHHEHDNPRSLDNKQSRWSCLFPFLQRYVSYSSPLIRILITSLFQITFQSQSYIISLTLPSLTQKTQTKNENTNRRPSPITSQHYPHARGYLARHSRYHRTSNPFTRCFQPKPEPRTRVRVNGRAGKF